GRGAYVNSQRLRVSGRRDLALSLVATGIPHMGRGDPERFSRELAAIMPAVCGVRRFGAAALDLAYVAAGRYDAFWETGLAPWDRAAGILLISEAGGMATEFNGRAQMLETGEILASNGLVHGPMTRLLREGRKSGHGKTA